MSVINQMLKDLDQQQGKKGPAVISQRPSLPKPPGRSNLLLWGLCVLLVIGGGFSLLAPERLTSALALLLPEPAQKTATAHKAAALSNNVAAVTTAPATPATKPESNPEPRPEPAQSTSQQNLAELVTAQAANNTAAVTAETATEQNALTAQPDAVAAEPAASEPVASAAAPVAAEPAVAGSAGAGATTVAVWPSEPDSSSQLYPAAKTETFAADNTAAQTTTPAPSSMQVEQVVFDKTMQLARLKQQASAALASASYAELGQKAQQYIELSPRDVQGYEWLAESYRQLQQWQLLQQLLQLCAAQQLSSDPLLLQQARLASLQKNWAGAEIAIQQISSSASTAEVLQLKANALQQQQKLAEALLAWQQLTTIQPGFSRGWLGQALVLEQLGQLPQAKQAYQQALTAGGLSAATVQFIQQRLATAE